MRKYSLGIGRIQSSGFDTSYRSLQRLSRIRSLRCLNGVSRQWTNSTTSEFMGKTIQITHRITSL
ncbi:MAG TPA: hypothetical protein PK910_10330 [Bacteroidales bacterium]|nr:hypothetical protein [Bacteroidales bacterium]HRC90398.1 hypothetical protein [Bacteroidales bacterium]